MVVPNMTNMDKTMSPTLDGAIELPTIDLLGGDRSETARLVVHACENFGFFKVVNHGVPNDVISQMEQQSLSFFAKPLSEKQLAGPASPFGYGLKSIGFNGDMGEIEYVLLNTNALSIAQQANTISSNDPQAFSCAVSWYIEAVRRLASEILDLMGVGLLTGDRVFSRLVEGSDTDSLLRLNHYPPRESDASSRSRVGIGEHSDPQMLTVLRSNDVGGLQIFHHDKVWVPVPPDPTAFWVNVGDLLQAMTNGRFVSVRHRAVTNSERARMSIAYFAAPSTSTLIDSPSELVRDEKARLYRPFTWGEYKRTTYSLRLGESRLHLFRASRD